MLAERERFLFFSPRRASKDILAALNVTGSNMAISAFKINARTPENCIPLTGVMCKAVALRVVQPRLDTILRAIAFALSVLSVGVAQSQSSNGSVGVQIMPTQTTAPPLGGLEGYGVPLAGSDSVPPAERGQVAPRQFFVAPIPVSSQAFGIGVVPVLGLVFPVSKTDGVSPPSMVMVGALLCLGRKQGVRNGYQSELAPTTVFCTTLLAAAYADLSYEVFGVGNAAGNTAKSIEVNQKGAFVYGQQLVGLGSGFFFGSEIHPGAYHFHFQSTSQPVPANLDPILDQFQVPITISSLGFSLQHDRRDSMFYPRAGHFFEGEGRLLRPSPWERSRLQFLQRRVQQISTNYDEQRAGLASERVRSDGEQCALLCILPVRPTRRQSRIPERPIPRLTDVCHAGGMANPAL